VASCDPHAALCVGDSIEHDVIGARRAGIRAVLLARQASEQATDARAGGAEPVAVIRTLDELPSLVLAGR
jgi:putative hydrolase of the HAD superfamily